MQVEPSFEAFAEVYAAGRAQIVSATLAGDLETPVAAFMKLAGDRPNAFLLESVEGGDTRGRYSMIGLEPDLIWRTVGMRAEVNRRARNEPNAFVPCNQAPLAALRA